MSGPAPQPLPWGFAWRLAVGQTVAWGVLYYSFAVVVAPMEAATGWSRTLLNTGLSLGLLVSGLAAPAVGAWIHRRGARGIMALGSLVGGLALAGIGAAQTPGQFLVAWAVLGAAMAAALYEPAFAAVTQAFGAEYRRGITLVTLVAGFASTIFVPLTQAAVGLWGWRAALAVIGAAEIAIVVPLCFWGIPARRPEAGAAVPASAGAAAEFARWWRDLRRDARDPRFLGLALWFMGHAAAFGGVVFQLLPAFQARGVDTATVITAIACIGPMQVAGRFALAASGDRWPTLRVGALATGALAAAMIVALVLPPTLPTLVAFGCLFGVGNGVITIVRGMAVAEVFGRERFAELNGALALPALLARAASPFLLAGVWSLSGTPHAVFATVLALLCVGGLGLRLAARPASS